MKQEDKDLLLKDLCGRLPYGVKVNFNNIHILRLGTHTRVGEYVTDVIEPCKPYLFPLSSMTDEQLYELREMFGFEIEFRDGSIELSTFHHNCLGYLEMVSLFEWFNMNHFDYRRLISKGLAIDCTNLNIY